MTKQELNNSIQQFFDKYINQGIDFDGYYGFQCMDLAHQFAVEVVGHDFSPAPAAKDVWNQNIEGYEKIANTPEGIPERGDIIIWGVGVGPYGHIAVFDHGDANSFVSYDQNWPLNSVCHFQKHNYNGVLGWFRPITQEPIPEPLPLPNPGYMPTHVGQTVEHNGMIYRSYEQDGKLLWTVSTPSTTTSVPVEIVTVPDVPSTTTSTPTTTVPTPPEIPNPPVIQPKKSAFTAFLQWLIIYLKKYLS